MSRRVVSLVVCAWLSLAPACGGDEDDRGNRPGGRDTSPDATESETATDPCDNGRQDPGEPDVDCGGGCAPCAEGKACFEDEDCASGVCGAGYLCRPAGCGNGTQDSGELGIDCGGPCPACLGAGCGVDADCATGYCKGGACDVPACNDGVRNGAETGVDCGGDCSQCNEGQGCLADANCVTGWCKAGFCATPSCGDGVNNQGESDVDCGGPCGGCADGKACAGGADCQGGACQAGRCVAVPPACDDGEKNGDETDVDCGGECAGCGFGKGCAAPSDCASGLCSQGACAAPASCDDGEKNGGESDTDCGGPCKACATGKYCGDHPDCLSVTCINGVCRDATCVDGVKNQGEADIDCAGPCAPCVDGKACVQADDCASASCSAGTCISCEDGKKNGSESDVDCGGGCGSCALGKGCTTPGDCLSAACEDGQCCTANACGQCVATPNEVCDGKDNDCNGQTDEAAKIGAPPACAKQQGVCAGSTSLCKGTAGWVCDDAIYQAHSAAYQAGETTCDGKDNDCDGQVDEGLLNPCGHCGPTPAEVCNSVDDDCDGQTDEGLLNACGHCGPTPEEVCNGVDDDCDGQTDEPVECHICDRSGLPATVATYTGTIWDGFVVLPVNWLGVLADDAWMLYTADDLHLARGTDGLVQEDLDLGVQPLRSASLAVGGGALHVGFDVLPCYTCEYKAQYRRYSNGGILQVSEEVATASSYGMNVMMWSQGAPWLAYLTPQAFGQVARRTGDGAWTDEVLFYVSNPWNFHVAIDDEGQRLALQGAYDDYSGIDLQASTSNIPLCETGCVQSPCATPCTDPMLGKAPDGTLYALFVRAGVINLQEVSYEWYGLPEEVVEGQVPNLSFTADSRPVISYVKGGTELWVATRQGTAWVTERVAGLTMPGATYAKRTGVGVDSLGRYHLGAVQFLDKGEGQSEQELTYVLFCSAAGGACVPDCAGKQCGNDGCGGSCGACGAGATCTAAQCVAATCGANPTKTCQGFCGGKADGGCWCDAACVDFGNCCPDHEACCP
jgi:hypothetical protein